MVAGRIALGGLFVSLAIIDDSVCACGSLIDRPRKVSCECADEAR